MDFFLGVMAIISTAVIWVGSHWFEFGVLGLLASVCMHVRRLSGDTMAISRRMDVLAGYVTRVSEISK